jgi:acetylglutamate kinase
VRVVLVHGGGRQASEQAAALGLPVRQVAGRRVTDDATLAVVTRALNGDANTALLAACRAAGLTAAGVCGLDGGLVVARRRDPVEVPGEVGPVDYGHVGDVERVHRASSSTSSRAASCPWSPRSARTPPGAC